MIAMDFLNQIRLGSYQLALPVPRILTLCNYLQNVGAKTYIFGLQLSTFLFYNKQFKKRMVNKRKTIFININGSREDVPEELAHLLDYLKTKTPTDGFTERLEQRVVEIRRDTEWRDDYMTLEMKMDEKYEQGREQGLKEGITKGIEQGIELGIGQGLRVQIQKKLNKGKSISQIADECEESEDTIRKIISEKGFSE